jgi:hypothetical protein
MSMAHPTKYPHVDNIRDQLATALAEGEPPGILSWHVHITYFLTSQTSIQVVIFLL